MKKIQSLASVLTMMLFLLSLATAAGAITTTTLTLSSTGGDAVRLTITGSPNSAVQLSFLPVGAVSVTSIAFGTTDSNGNFSTSISSGGYGIPAGSPVYVAISGVQSATMLWPTYASLLSLSQTNLQLAVGQSVILSGSEALILAANSLSSAIAAAISGSQATITGISSGTGTVTLCGANVGCVPVAVQVGGQAGQTQITFNKNNLALNSKESQTVYVYGGSNNGYNIKSNSNGSAVSASISGASNIVSLYANETPGVAAIVICSVESSSNCATLNVTTLNTYSATLSFSQNNLSLLPGVTQSVTVSGGPNNNYYISANSNSGVVQATLAANVLTVVGGSNAGPAVITVCSTSVNNNCGNLNVTTTTTPATPTATTLAFSQNVVTVPQGETTNVTVTGGSGTGYSISSNSSPAVATASISGASNVISLYGSTLGSTIVAVCSAGESATCASLYVTVGTALVPIYFSQNNLSLSPGEKAIISISGGAGSGKVVADNSNSNVASAALSASSDVVVVTGGNAAGSTEIKICSSLYNTNCATLNVRVVALVVAPPPPVTPVAEPTAVVTGSGTVLGTRAFKFTSLLTLGSTGAEVSELQKLLKRLGYFTYPAITKFFGSVTRQAVVAFQKANKLAPYPGWVGPATRAALNKVSG